MIAKAELSEFVGQIIDVFEDFLASKRITHRDLGNFESPDPWTDEHEVDAVIYGSQYDEIANSVKNLISEWELIDNN